MADIIRFPTHHPLMQPVTWQGRQYFTSHVLHQEYLKTPAHIVNQEAIKAALWRTGVDFRPALQSSPTQDHIRDEQMMLEPDYLGKHLGLGGGIEMNRMLHHWGWQVRTPDNRWEPTEQGKPYSSRHAFTSKHSSHTGYNYKWNVATVEHEILRRRKEGSARDA